MNISSSSSSSEGLPLQPYDFDRSSGSGSRTSVSVQLLRRRPVEVSPFGDVELQFLRVVGRNRVRIVQPAEILLESASWQADMTTRSGFTMQVHRGTWEGKAVALKRIKGNFGGGTNSSSADALREYGAAMNDLNFELQIMSKKSLYDHRNITKLLAVSFGTSETMDTEAEGQMVLPILIVELADPRFPDLSLFLDPRYNQHLPSQLPFDTAASIIADIADGVAALHSHDVVHADLKPENILMFPDEEAPGGFVAKISDFGFSGMATYNMGGQRAWLPGGRPRGGTTEWNAPECLDDEALDFANTPEFARREQVQDKSSRDVYSFGLLASYVALDGQSPKAYIPSLRDVKLQDTMVKAVQQRLEEYYSDALNHNLVDAMIEIADLTLRLDPERRTKGLGSIRQMLFGRYVLIQIYRLVQIYEFSL
jgi:serine/threonine protein kinase